MQILFRTNSSEVIGSGHFLRCFYLAQEMKRKNWQVFFATSQILERHKLLLVEENIPIFDLVNSEQDMVLLEIKEISEYLSKYEIDNLDWIVIDDYRIGSNSDLLTKLISRNLLIIEDLHSEYRDCEIIVDMNFRNAKLYEEILHKYRNTKVLVGPLFALLNSEIAEFHKTALIEVCKGDAQIFINFGTLDEFSLTKRTIEIILNNLPRLRMNVVIQGNNRDRDQLEKLADRFPNSIELFVEPISLTQIMSACRLSIGAGGISLWERFSLGLNCIIVTTASNQEGSIIDLSKQNLVSYLGSAQNLRDSDLLESLLINLNKIESTNHRDRRLMAISDGLGCKRIIREILELS
jgi:UDP-2,4-diacetamido-2,4,6-trideoxy-beta-L-altropyranose hydrolase